MFSKKNKKGFTLIELLVVISVIGMLSTFALVALQNSRIKARDARRLADIKQIQKALELYYDANDNQYPNIHQARSYWSAGAGNNWGNGAGSLGAALKPYMNPLPVDPLNDKDAQEYRYDSEGDGYGLMCALEGSEWDDLETNDNGIPSLWSNNWYEVGPDVNGANWWSS